MSDYINKIMFFTGNKAKIKILKSILSGSGVNVVSKKQDLTEIQELDVNKVCMEKAVQAIKKSKNTFVVEDSGLRIPALGGFPGALLRYAVDSIGCSGICKLLDEKENRIAFFDNVFILGNPKTGKLRVAQVILKGSISSSPRGSAIFGWGIESIFVPSGSTKTIAEYSKQEFDIFWNSILKSVQARKLAQMIIDSYKTP